METTTVHCSYTLTPAWDRYYQELTTTGVKHRYQPMKLAQGVKLDETDASRTDSTDVDRSGANRDALATAHHPVQALPLHGDSATQMDGKVLQHKPESKTK